MGWRVQVLPWVIGTRCVLDIDCISKAMAFMEIPEQRRKDRLRRTAVVSVEALVFMHRVRKSGNLRVRVAHWPLCGQWEQSAARGED